MRTNSNSGSRNELKYPKDLESHPNQDLETALVTQISAQIKATEVDHLTKLKLSLNKKIMTLKFTVNHRNTILSIAAKATNLEIKLLDAALQTYRDQ